MQFVPFRSDTHAGFGEVAGIVKLTDDARLVLEFETRDALLGVLRSGTRTLEVPFADIDRVEARFSWSEFSPVLRIRVSDFAMANALSMPAPGWLTLGITWGDRRDARRLAETLNGFLFEYRHRRWQRQMDQMLAERSLPTTPGQADQEIGTAPAGSPVQKGIGSAPRLPEA
jgi:hypothetical protein